jgi:hypothetical protein
MTQVGPVRAVIPGSGWPVVYKKPRNGSYSDAVQACRQLAHSETNWLLEQIAHNRGALPAVNAVAKAIKHSCTACVRTSAVLALSTGQLFVNRGRAEQCGVS